MEIGYKFNGVYIDIDFYVNHEYIGTYYVKSINEYHISEIYSYGGSIKEYLESIGINKPSVVKY